MKNLVITSAAIALTYLTPLSAIASPVVRTIKQTQASGQTAKLQTINVWNGHGVVISFYEVGERIKRVWLDDPSQILVDTDGCLEGINQNCQSSGAGLIHLRRIKRVNIPGLPQTPSTLLTVITETASGERKAYSFRVSAANGTPKYSQVVIAHDVPIEAKKRTVPQLQSLITTTKTINSIRNGMTVAIRNNLLNPGDELHQRLKKLINYIRQGDELATAADKAIVSMGLVNKLMSLEGNQKL
jgi:hypothetical protein